ncbi:Rossmann-fold NAD(P)-binding domain-containing protein [Streptomyces tubercidicus]|uniref:hypothetical protein n=1 Tax=Streptomyces tubercidicus TaxID=47759 RepID=UPI0036906A52
MQPITCVFADDSTHSLTELGKAHQALCAAPPPFSSAALLLHTCQRIEWYAAAELIPSALVLLGQASTTGHRAALTRLAQIAAGTRSLIPGERLVQVQVQNAATRLYPSHPIYDISRKALALAARARERFGLVAIADYSDLPMLLLEERARQPKQLLVIGGGMLARAVAAAPPEGYERVVMMTRGPRKLRRLVDGLGNVTVVRGLPSLDRALDGAPYDTVIATTNLHADYQQQVQEAAVGPLSGRVLDLCGTPALEERPDGYSHLYDPDVLQVLADANRGLSDSASLARQWIAENAEVRV